MTPKEFDDQVQAQLNVVTMIISASSQNQETAEAAIAALDHMRRNIEQSVNALSRDVIKKVESAAETTATETAKLLQAKFAQADEQANAAALRYERAAQWLKLKLLMFVVLALTVIFGAAWLIISVVMPSPSELQERRQELAYLERKAIDLERRGVRLEWTTCNKALCFRTDKSKGDWNVGEGTYQVPFKARR